MRIINRFFFPAYWNMWQTPKIRSTASRPDLESGMEFERLENDANWKGRKVDVAINCNCCLFIDSFMESIASDRHDMVWLTRMSIRWWANGSHQERMCVCVWCCGAPVDLQAKKQKYNLQLFRCTFQCTQFERCTFEVTCKSQRSNHVWEMWRSNVAHRGVQCTRSTAAVNATKDLLYYYSANSDVQRIKWSRVKERKKEKKKNNAKEKKENEQKFNSTGFMCSENSKRLHARNYPQKHHK